MTTTVIADEIEESLRDKPGAQLAASRIAKGLSAEYVAGKLHLRVRIIELLEADDYLNMPEPVFIKGYIRAYAKLLDVPSEPLLAIFNGQCVSERKLEKALWQGKRETHRGERIIRWLTTIFALVVVGAVAMWWQNNKENEHLLPTNMSRAEASHNQSETEIRLTDLSKMRSLLSSNASTPMQSPSTESQDG
jgi:cytoskeleton protein RodZ